MREKFAYPEISERSGAGGLKIAVGARDIGQAGGTGVCTYSLTLMAALQANGFCADWAGSGKNIVSPHSMPNRLKRFLFSCSPRQRSFFSDSAGEWEITDCFRRAQVHFSISRRLTSITSTMLPDYVHWTYPFPLYWREAPNIYTIHDLIPIKHPDLTGINALRMKQILHQCLKKATYIITPSQAVCDDIRNCFPEFGYKIANFYQAIDMKPLAPAEKGANPDNAPTGSFLYFGTIEKRKNIHRLIEAHGLSRTHRPLILIGNNGFLARTQWTALQAHPRPELVQHVHWCERSVLLRHIQHARAVLFPSLAEGFGLPIIEAMNLQTPVMTSQGHATEEIAGGAAALVNPYDTKEMAEIINLLDHSDETCSALVRKGKQRAAFFSPASYAARIGNFYRSL